MRRAVVTGIQRSLFTGMTVFGAVLRNGGMIDAEGPCRERRDPGLSAAPHPRIPDQVRKDEGGDGRHLPQRKILYWSTTDPSACSLVLISRGVKGTFSRASGFSSTPIPGLSEIIR